jgi:hypothetical protein
LEIGRNVGTNEKNKGRIVENPGIIESGENEGKAHRDLANFQKRSPSDSKI